MWQTLKKLPGHVADSAFGVFVLRASQEGPGTGSSLGLRCVRHALAGSLMLGQDVAGSSRGWSRPPPLSLC